MSSNEMPVEQARKVLGDLVANAQLAGVTTIITRYGRPAALITPIPQEPAMLAVNLEGLTLPKGIHADTLTDVDTESQRVAYTVIWGEPAMTRCPRCDEPVPAAACPVTLNGGAGAGGQLDSADLQHGCGEWISQRWEAVRPGEHVAQVVARVAEQRAEDVRAETARIRDGLRAELAAALERLESGDDPDDVRTGTDVDPGVCQEDGQWIAWAYGPDGEQALTVYAP